MKTVFLVAAVAWVSMLIGVALAIVGEMPKQTPVPPTIPFTIAVMVGIPAVLSFLSGYGYGKEGER
jgi:ABC-type phosphate transport system permease subunit